MRFKLDENLPRMLLELLRSAGHDADTVSDEGLAGAKDPAVLARCQGEQRTFLTFDLDFADIRQYPPTAHSGILVLRLRSHAIPHVRSVIERLLPLLESEPVVGWLWIIDEEEIRLRR